MADSDVVNIGAERFAALLQEAAKLGAEEALRELGLEKPEDRNDLREAVKFGRMLKKTQENIWTTVVSSVTKALLLAALAGVALGILKQVP